MHPLYEEASRPYLIDLDTLCAKPAEISPGFKIQSHTRRILLSSSFHPYYILITSSIEAGGPAGVRASACSNRAER
jgi:hypothetical protein